MIRSDERSRWKWTAGVLSDSRVKHFWDENKIIGQWFSTQTKDWGDDGSVLERNSVVWDTYFLYSPNAEWKDTPGKPISWGSTINGQQEKLKSGISPLLMSSDH